MNGSSPAMEWTASSARPGPLAHWARRQLLPRLRNLKYGQLLLRDPWGTERCGDTGPLVEVDIHHAGFYADLVFGGSLGAADSYLRQRWSCQDLTSLFRLFIHNEDLADAMDGGVARAAASVASLAHRLRANTRTGSRRNIRDHYDLGNELFALFLDDTMTYSAGIFDHPDAELRDASLAKLDRICRKLRLGPEDHVLETGGGWGSFALYAAGRYGCRVTTTTISEQQFQLARERIAAAGLGDRVEILLEDYRDLRGQFDKLVSIEMIEAVGHRFLPDYFRKCASLLRPHGQMLVQAIAMPDHRYRQYLRQSDFIQRYVFPGSCCPAR